MPHSTTSSTARRTPSLSRGQSFSKAYGDGTSAPPDSGMEKFPDHVDSHLTTDHQPRSSSPAANGYANGRDTSRERWLPRRDSRSVRFPTGPPPPAPNGRGHTRQKSLSDAFRTIRSRKGSVTQNAHEIADALKAPVSPTLVVCHPFRPPSALSPLLTLSPFADPLHLVVRVVGHDQHILQIHPHGV